MKTDRTRGKPESTVLALIDIQGKLAQLMHEKDDLFKKVICLIRGMKILGIPIVWFEQCPDKLGTTIPEIEAELTGIERIKKVTFSSCGVQEFDDFLGVSKPVHVVVSGIETHICVYQTVADLLQLGYEVEVVADAVSSRTPFNKQLGLDKMVSLGARLSSVEMILFELLQTAEGDAFRSIIKLVK